MNIEKSEMDYVYVVIANRWGDPGDHSYVVGAYKTPREAFEYAVIEEYWRGGKYQCHVKAIDTSKRTDMEIEKRNWVKEKVGMGQGFKEEVDQLLNKFMRQVP